MEELMSDYTAVLADLRAKRDKLNVAIDLTSGEFADRHAQFVHVTRALGFLSAMPPWYPVGLRQVDA